MSDRIAEGAEAGRASYDLTCGVLFLRLSLAMAFFASVADRFNLLQPFHWDRWGDFQYLLLLWTSRQLPGRPLLASVWAFSIVEMILGASLLLGLLTRLSSLAGGWLLLCTSLAVMVEPKSSISYSVPAAAAGSFLLASLPAAAGRFSLDSLWKLQHVGSGRWVGRLVRIGTVAGLLLLTLLVTSMIGDVMHCLRVI
ncbi:MAG TPA: DoxX family membrane protein [Thermoanaerobaculia bacterium]|nr:DoxX family membrane protein [Thermoanaerobaculia bacterium]